MGITSSAPQDAAIPSGQGDLRGTRGRRTRALILVAAGAGAAAWLLVGNQSLPSASLAGAPPSLPTASVTTGMVERTVRLNGTTEGEHNVTIRAPYMRGSRTRGGGDFHLTLVELAGEGTVVQPGATIAVFDRTTMLERLDNLRAELVQDEKLLQSLNARLVAEREAHDQQLREAQAAADIAALDLKTAPVRSAIQADIFRLNLEEARAHYKQVLSEEPFLRASQDAQKRMAELNVQQSALEVKRAEVNADRMTVRSPRGGIVVLRETFRGGQFFTIRAGDELRPGQPYVDIVAPGPMIVEAVANQVDVTRLRIGQRARVIPDAYPELELPAHIYAVGGVARSNGWRATYVKEVPVYLRLDRTDPRVIPSLTVSAEVVLAERKNSTVVPTEALFSNPSGGTFAYVRGTAGWEKRALEVGLAGNNQAAVESGLQPGEVVALEAPEAILN
jgi:HlyD family secretion protein